MQRASSCTTRRRPSTRSTRSSRRMRPSGGSSIETWGPSTLTFTTAPALRRPGRRPRAGQEPAMSVETPIFLAAIGRARSNSMPSIFARVVLSVDLATGHVEQAEERLQHSSLPCTALALNTGSRPRDASAPISSSERTRSRSRLLNWMTSGSCLSVSPRLLGCGRVKRTTPRCAPILADLRVGDEGRAVRALEHQASRRTRAAPAEDGEDDRCAATSHRYCGRRRRAA